MTRKTLTNHVTRPAVAKEFGVLLQRSCKSNQQLRTPFNTGHLVARLGLQPCGKSLGSQAA